MPKFWAKLFWLRPYPLPHPHQFYFRLSSASPSKQILSPPRAIGRAAILQNADYSLIVGIVIPDQGSGRQDFWALPRKISRHSFDLLDLRKLSDTTEQSCQQSFDPSAFHRDPEVENAVTTSQRQREKNSEAEFEVVLKGQHRLPPGQPHSFKYCRQEDE